VGDTWCQFSAGAKKILYGIQLNRLRIKRTDDCRADEL
jgi:hypothetical protein